MRSALTIGFLFLASLIAVQAQELTITLTLGTGNTHTKTITGAPVSAGLEVLEQWRLTQCLVPAENFGGPCLRYKYATIGEALTALIVGQIQELSKRFPTSATAQERAAAAAAASALEAKRKALFDAALEDK